MKDKHVFIAGPSGGGKTTLLREIHDTKSNISIWIAHPNADNKNVNGIVVKSLEDLVLTIRKANSKTDLEDLRFIYKTSIGTDAALQEPLTFAKQSASYFNRELEIQFCVDEVQHFLPDNRSKSSVQEGNLAAWILHQGRDSNLKLVSATQDPMEVYYPPIKNCRYFVWVGKSKTFHRGFINYFGLQEIDLPDEYYHYAVIDPTDPPKIVSEDTTKEKYG